MNEEMLIHGTQCRALHINSIYSLKLLETTIGSIGTFIPPPPRPVWIWEGRAQALACTHAHVYGCVLIA